MKDLVLIQACPSDLYILNQVELQLHNLRELGYSSKYVSLVFIPNDRLHLPLHPGWKALQEKYPEATFRYYGDTEDILNKNIRKINYIPLLRPWMLQKYFERYPELKEKAIFYYDSDVLFTRAFPFNKYIQDGDDTCYLSDTASYLNLEYWEGKIEQSPKKDKLRELRPISTLAEKMGINRDVLVANNDGVGGAQYLLKNIDADFWRDVFNDCILIRPYFMNLNRQYFSSEDAGWQSWTADMIAVLWNLWKRGYKTETPKDMDFVWATDPISKIDDHYIYHNAGVSSQIMNMNGEDVVMFYKGLYANAAHAPYNDVEYLKSVDPRYASYYYAQQLLAIENPIINKK